MSPRQLFRYGELTTSLRDFQDNFPSDVGQVPNYVRQKNCLGLMLLVNQEEQPHISEGLSDTIKQIF